MWYQKKKYADKLNFFDALNLCENIHRLPACVWCQLFCISSYHNDVFNVIPVNTYMYLKNGTVTPRYNAVVGRHVFESRYK